MSILLIKAFFLIAAPCCGGGGNLPGLILGNERLQLGMSGSYSTIVGDVASDGYKTFRSNGDVEDSYLISLSTGFLLSDRWQAGASVSSGYRVLDRTTVVNSGAGWGDVRAHVGYEIMPLWTYSVWRPKGFIFAHVTVPTGKSTFDSTEAGAVDSFGQGFWSSGLGFVAVKTWRVLDASFLGQLQYSFPRQFKEPREISVAPGFQAAAQLGFGWSPGASSFRVGARVGPAWRQGGESVLYGEASTGVDRLVWDATIEANWMIGSAVSLSAFLTDQSLLGPSNNTMLSRSGGLSVQYRSLR